MATGEDRVPRVKRTYVLEGLLSDDGGIVQQRARAQQIVDDMMSAGWVVGGAIRIVFDRVKVGELPPGKPGMPRDALAETVGVVIEYQANTPLNRESLTERLLANAYDERPDAPVAGGLGGELEAMADSVVESDPDANDQVDPAADRGEGRED